MRTILAATAVAALVTASGAHAQDRLRYELDPESTFREGCFDGTCLCPEWQAESVTGFFYLKEVSRNGISRKFAVSDFRVTVEPSFGESGEISGSGDYERFEDGTHAMSLALSYKGNDIELESGRVTGAGDLSFLDLVVEFPETDCYNVQIRIVAESDPITTEDTTWGRVRQLFAMAG